MLPTSKQLEDLRIAGIRPGGFFEDETGWWQLDEFEHGPDGTITDGWFLGRDGDERLIPLSRFPALSYL